MTSQQLPWWLDKDKTPREDGFGKALWVLGQWCFIPFASDGTPLRRRCSSLAEARAEVDAFEKEVMNREKEIESFGMQAQDMHAIFLKNDLDEFRRFHRAMEIGTPLEGFPSSIRIFSVDKGHKQEPCFLVQKLDGKPATLFRSRVAETYDDAVEQVGAFAVASRP